MFRWLSGAFPSVSGLIPLQGKSEYGWILVPGGQIGLFHLQELWRTSWPQGHPDREKSFNLSPRDLGPSPLNAGQVWHLDLVWISIFHIRGFPAWHDNTMLKIDKLVTFKYYGGLFFPSPFVLLIRMSWVLDLWSRFSSYGYGRKCTIVGLLRLVIYFFPQLEHFPY